MDRINKAYTNSDHAIRDYDVYALAKYKWTIRKMKSLGISQKLKIANIGCGSGTFNAILANAGYEVLATEPDPDAYEMAKVNLPNGCQIRQIGLFELDEKVDVVIMHDVLEHIDAESAAIEKIAELLKPGGYFIASVPALDQLFGYHDIQLGHFRRYTRASMKRALSQRFNICKIRYYGFLSIPITFILSRLLRKEYPQLDQSGTSLLQRTYGILCAIEGRVPSPIGTAILVIAQLK
jgi:2-polyprenyl-3-methyl-5-hydroxy-6-metoxy-1,4-benzoquinol methylase